ncbi:MAG: imidazole glycerol phosphate synthase subunit HisH [Acidobacteria bacterium]|nr:imidazole glycerol phosphate synthase subunit HisH [Acidobacteriota bacterium]
MIVVVDYKAGNLYNVAHALRHLRADFVFSADPRTVATASRVILPGVGSARAAMDSLREQGLTDVLRNLEVPFLGICLGLQLLFERSEEEDTPCLGVLKGVVRKFPKSEFKVPQIGWNNVCYKPGTDARRPQLFDGIPDGSYFYFVHSYFAPLVPELTVASTEYVVSFSSAVRKENFWGVQFHPERSGEAGLRLLGNFLDLN